MKQLISIIIFLASAVTTLGQLNFDSLDNIKFSQYYQQIDSKFNLNKNSEFEFRLWATSALTNHKNVFILSKNNFDYKARFFEFDFFEEKHLWVERKVNQNQLDSLWKKLVKNQIITLPTQSSLKSRMRIYSIDSTNLENYNSEDEFMIVRITDGTGYRFEVLSSTGHRVYNYANPEGYLKYFSNIEEFYRVAVIIKLIKQHLLKLP